MQTPKCGTRLNGLTPDTARDVAMLDRLKVAFALFTVTGDRIRRSTAAVDLLATRPDEWERIADRVRAMAWLSTESLRERQPTALATAVYSISQLGAGFAIVVFIPIPLCVGADETRWAPLTNRERQVAECIACGGTSRDVAQCLGISVHTARRHTESVYAKLGVRRRTDITRIALTSPSRPLTRE